jgi:4-hydroxybenzoate polyprenyltransferase
MNTTVMGASRSTLSTTKLFFALSRTPHGLLDMATPAMAAILWYGAIPPLRIALLGIITAFAGYTAVYALNDLVDYHGDTQKIQAGGFTNTENYLDAVLVRHPLAYGLLTFRKALLWTVAWAALAFTGAYLLNPVCAGIFLAAALLEAVYCCLWRTTCLRTLVSGAVKTSGAMAAVFAVDGNPSPAFLALLFFWLFLWEIGGQNIPADWTDIEEDRQSGAKSIPVCFGPAQANRVVLSCLACTLALNVIMLLFLGAGNPVMIIIASLCAGFYLLLIPAFRLYRTKERANALVLFNRASYYPAVMLVLVAIDAMV